MKQTRLIMGMPITVEVVDRAARDGDLAAVFDYFTYIDEKFSTYKPGSEIMHINRGELAETEWSDDMRIIFMLAEETKQRTDGFFDIRRPRGLAHPDGGRATGGREFYDPSGIVKGWAIWQASKILDARGLKNYYIEAGGDIQTHGWSTENARGVEEKPWSIGIKNPLKKPAIGEAAEIVKTIYAPFGENSRDHERSPVSVGVATSGTYIRGNHIYNPKNKNGAKSDTPSRRGVASTAEIVSLTVIGPNIYEADRFATAAFATGGQRAIHFIESLPGFEGYMIDAQGIATMTTGFKRYTKNH